MFSASVLATTAAAGLYSGHRVVRVDTPSIEESAKFHALVEADEMDVWHKGDGFVDVRVPANVKSSAEDLSAVWGLNTTVVEEDVQTYFDRVNSEWKCKSGEEACAKDEFYQTYQELNVIERRMDALVSSSDFATGFTIGRSEEGRDIRGYTLTSSRGGNKLVAAYHCGIHSREWLPIPFCLWLGEKLVEGYAEGETQATTILDNYEIHIIPVLNPDGYVYTHEVDNNWRKSRKVNANSNCVGTDLNRNLPYQWGTGGSSTDPCSNTYMGVDPLDNVETRLLYNWIGQLRPLVYMDIHASGNMWLAPMGYRPREICLFDPRPCGVDNDDEYNRYMASGEASRVAIQAVHGQNFRVGPITFIIYQASGTTVDTMYNDHGVTYAYSPEVRAGFQPSPENIILSNEELYEGTKAQLMYGFENAN